MHAGGPFLGENQAQKHFCYVDFIAKCIRAPSKWYFSEKIGPTFISLPGGPRPYYGQIDGKMGGASEIKFQGTSRRPCSLSEIKYNCHFAFGRIPHLKPPASSKEKDSKTPEETIHHVSKACIIQEQNHTCQAVRKQATYTHLFHMHNTASSAAANKAYAYSVCSRHNARLAQSYGSKNLSLNMLRSVKEKEREIQKKVLKTINNNSDTRVSN